MQFQSYVGVDVYVLHVRSSEGLWPKPDSVDRLTTDQDRVQRKLWTTYTVPRFPRSCLQSSKSLLTYTIIVPHFFIVPIIVIYHSKLGRPRAAPSAKHLLMIELYGEIQSPKSWMISGSSGRRQISDPLK